MMNTKVTREDDVRLRELFAHRPLSEAARDEVKAIFQRSKYSCLHCLMDDYTPPPHGIHAH